MLAIQGCSNSINTEEELSIATCSDSQAGLKALPQANSRRPQTTWSKKQRWH